ncbi:hypothetical protein DJ533_13390 [Acinetobacter defluvii]|uniref:Uncharacterized protein n=1 Tax=Acinetobacter defluvii TaxID=1871111 RepID=A0A2S2FEY4_9GAMM|nr:hypothetical protein [Acinetobacter defluvii]AWL29499.1 hypothetical protein DJ533_13390 [Acinetobacter defluvii]
MNHYIKTELGTQALQQRLFDLSPKLRRLLLLIGTPDFHKLTTQLQKNIATPEMLRDLESLGLIKNLQAKSQTATEVSHTQIAQEKVEKIIVQKVAANIASSHPSDMPSRPTPQVNLALDNEIILRKLDFTETKNLMIRLLRQNCGLMAKMLIQKIESAEHSQALKLCQMQWLTALQETRISPIELNKNLQMINYSMQHFEQQSY